MSSYSIVRGLSVELRQQIFSALQAASETIFTLTSPDANISLEAPYEPGETSRLVSLYLYHVDIDHHLRNRQPLTDRTDPTLQRRAPLPLRLRYLMTPLDADETMNHLILGRIIQHFHDHPSLGTLDGVDIGDSFGGGPRELRVRPDLMTMEQLAQIWNAFNTPYRLSLSLLVETMAIDSALPPARKERVREAVFASGPGAR